MAGSSSMPPPRARAPKPAAMRPRRRMRFRSILSRIRTEILPFAILKTLQLYPDDVVPPLYSPAEGSNPPVDAVDGGVKTAGADREQCAGTGRDGGESLS